MRRDQIQRDWIRFHWILWLTNAIKGNLWKKPWHWHWVGGWVKIFKQLDVGMVLVEGKGRYNNAVMMDGIQLFGCERKSGHTAHRSSSGCYILHVLLPNQNVDIFLG